MSKALLGAAGFALLAACGPSMGDELAPTTAADTACHVLPEAVNVQFPEVTKTFAVQLGDRTRTLMIGVDSASRVRMFAASANTKVGMMLTVRMSLAKIAADGTMETASRTITTGDVDAKRAKSDTEALSPGDTARVRALVLEAVTRCVKA